MTERHARSLADEISVLLTDAGHPAAKREAVSIAFWRDDSKRTTQSGFIFRSIGLSKVVVDWRPSYGEARNPERRIGELVAYQRVLTAAGLATRVEEDGVHAEKKSEQSE